MYNSRDMTLKLQFTIDYYTKITQGRPQTFKNWTHLPRPKNDETQLQKERLC